MNEIEELQRWYYAQCNGDWEHCFGIRIGTLDNPGWFVEIKIEETHLENVVYEKFSYGVGEEAKESGDNWLLTKVENSMFIGEGGPHKLQEILKIFIEWSKSNT